MRIVHTADWHLGQSLFDVSREREHGLFLEWLVELLVDEEADALIVAGDVFDQASPSSSALSTWYRFVARARARLPGLDMIFVGGNHDSPSRLEAPAPILDGLRVRVVGRLPRRADGSIDADRVVVPLHDRSGAVSAWCAAVPFLHAFDLPPAEGADDPLVEGVRAVYREVLDEAFARRGDGQPVVATGHLYAAGGVLSELSERKVLQGNLHALPADVFPDSVAYVALGHLHLAQSVGGREHVRYSGAPIPLAMPEAAYRHQVCVADLDGGGTARVRSLPVPRFVEFERVPADGPGDPVDVLAALASLPPEDPAADPASRPLLEVRVRLAAPMPGLRQEVEAALEGRAARLVRLSIEHAGPGGGLRAGDATSLEEVSPDHVFDACWRRRFDCPPPDEVRAAFAELVEAAKGAEA
jgi:exonuclease SbcD